MNTDPALILDLRLVLDLLIPIVSYFLFLWVFGVNTYTFYVVANSNRSLCSKVFHVRSVTQGDVIRADAKDIPRIFQVFIK